MTVGEWLRRAAAINSSDPDARADAAMIIEEALGIPRSQMLLQSDRQMTGEETRGADNILKRHIEGEPLQYIFGKAPFMGFEFCVDARVLIPRMDTETLALSALSRLKPQADVLDLCTGSGAVGISIKRLRPDARVTLADISSGALEVAALNAKDIDVSIVKSDMFGAFESQKFDMITCNPPYIRKDEMLNLQKEVLREPRLALNGGADGLDFYRRLARDARKHAAPGGDLLMEVGAGQAADVMAMFGASGAIRDLNGIERVVWVKFE